MTSTVPEFCRRPRSVYRWAASVLGGCMLLLWTLLVGEICDWGKFTAWWSVSEPVGLESGGPTIRTVDPRIPDFKPGDRVVDVNGTAIESTGDWNLLLRHSRPGDIWRIGLTRDGAPYQVNVRLGQDGWRYITAASGIMVIPLLVLLWLFQFERVRFQPCLDHFMLAGVVANAALSIFLGHFPFVGLSIPALLIEHPAALALATLFEGTTPAFAIYFLWRWPAPLQLTTPARAALIAAAILLGLAQSGAIQDAGVISSIVLGLVGVASAGRAIAAARHLFPSAQASPAS